MKKALTLLLALALGMTAFAQYGPGRPGGMGRSYGSRPGYGYGYGYGMGGVLELGVSINDFTGDNADVYRPDRLGFFGEYRMDLGGNLDMGMQLSTTFGSGSLSYTQQDTWYWQGAALVVGDFNLLPYNAFNPYVGLGIGPGFGLEKYRDHGYPSEWTHTLVISPRMGVELFESLRMSVQYQWFLTESRKYSHLAFGLSWAFQPGMGGRPRRPMR